MTIALPTAAAELTPKQEAFAVAFVECSDATAAYRAIFDCSPDIARSTLHKRAYDLRHHPKVEARINQLRQAVAEKFTVSEAQLRLEAYELASVDPNSVCGVRIGCCRHCWGIDGRYQWVDQNELFAAAAHVHAAANAPKRPKVLPSPDPLGGDGYDRTRDPNEDCKHCRGEGVMREYIMDTTKLKGAARRLFKGFERKPDGTLRLLLHDQMTARDMVNKSVGLYKSVNLSLHAEVTPFQDMTMADMLDTLNKLKPAQPAADPTVVATIEHQEPAP